MHPRALAIIGVFLGCTSRLPEATWRPGPEPNIEGTWILELQVIGSYKGGASRHAKGGLDLHCNVSAPKQEGRPCSDYSVTYDSTLRSMLGPEVYGPPGAATTADGLVHLWFNPRLDHGKVDLQGMVRGDSVIGEWRITSYADDGYAGRFVLARRS
jgi:hypothetical protein